MILFRPSRSLLPLGILAVAAACGGSDGSSVTDPVEESDESTNNDGPSETAAGTDGFRVENGIVIRPDVGVITMSGALDEDIQEADPVVLFRDVGGCLQDEFAIGTFVDRLESPGAEIGTTIYTMSATAEIGAVGPDTRGDVPVELELNALNDITIADDDVQYRGTGTITILDQRIVQLPDDFIAPELALELVGDVESDGETVSITWNDSIGLICS